MDIHIEGNEILEIGMCIGNFRNVYSNWITIRVHILNAK